jgi:hypothetical protein
VVVSVRSHEDHEEYVIFDSRLFASTEHITSKGYQDKWELRVDKHIKGGIRVAGDIKVQIDDTISGLAGARQYPICWAWVHSQFLKEPPDHMGGVSRALSEAECRNMGVPEGTYALALRKHEIDRAAKDIKQKHFHEQFQVEVFWRFLPGETGTGARLSELVQAAKKDLGTVAWQKRVANIMFDEKARYSAYRATCAEASQAPVTFAEHVLSHHSKTTTDFSLSPLADAAGNGSGESAASHNADNSSPVNWRQVATVRQVRSFKNLRFAMDGRHTRSLGAIDRGWRQSALPRSNSLEQMDTLQENMDRSNQKASGEDTKQPKSTDAKTDGTGAPSSPRGDAPTGSGGRARESVVDDAREHADTLDEVGRSAQLNRLKFEGYSRVSHLPPDVPLPKARQSGVHDYTLISVADPSIVLVGLDTTPATLDEKPRAGTESLVATPT